MNSNSVVFKWAGTGSEELLTMKPYLSLVIRICLRALSGSSFAWKAGCTLNLAQGPDVRHIGVTRPIH